MFCTKGSVRMDPSWVEIVSWFRLLHLFLDMYWWTQHSWQSWSGDIYSNENILKGHTSFAGCTPLNMYVCPQSPKICSTASRPASGGKKGEETGQVEAGRSGITNIFILPKNSSPFKPNTSHNARHINPPTRSSTSSTWGLTCSLLWLTHRTCLIFCNDDSHSGKHRETAIVQFAIPPLIIVPPKWRINRRINSPVWMASKPNPLHSKDKGRR